MKRLCLLLLLCACFFTFGCLTEADKRQWQEVWKDWRGDNMKMRSDFSSTK